MGLNQIILPNENGATQPKATPNETTNATNSLEQSQAIKRNSITGYIEQLNKNANRHQVDLTDNFSSSEKTREISKMSKYMLKF